MSIRSVFSKFVDEARDPGMTSLELRDGNPLNNPAVPLSSPALWQWLTGGEPTAAGETVNVVNALQIVTVYDCVRILSESVASLPLELWERTEGGRQKAIDQALYYLLAVEPNPEMSAFTFKENLVGCLALAGNGFAQIERNGVGQAIALWPLHPLKTKPVRQGNKLVYETTDGMPLGQKRTIQPEDILHVPLFSFDGILGLSPIQLARQSLGLAKATEKFGARFFGNGSRPGGVVFNKGPKPDLKTQQEIKESWNSQQGGTNQGKTAFLFGGEWDYKQIGLSPEDSQFLATRQFQRAEIASLFRIPPHYVGDTSRLSGNNAEQQNLQFVTDTLRPYLSRIENEIIRKLMPTVGRKANKYFVTFDVSERLRGDFKTQQEGFAAGVQWGWFNPNDVRGKLGENPGPKELDVYRVPVNMQAAETLLDTESIQDQPVPTAPPPGGTTPPAQDAGGLDDSDQGDSAPSDEERNLLGVYTRSYITLWKDSFQRLSKRSKRDSAAIGCIFRPVLRSIADLAIEHNGAENPELADRLVADVLAAMEKRSAKWPAPLSDDTAAAEFLKAVRSIHINAAKEISAAHAAAEVSE